MYPAEALHHYWHSNLERLSHLCMFSVFRWTVVLDYPCCPHTCYPLASFSKRDINAGTGNHNGSEQLLPQHQRGVSHQQLLQQQSWWLVPTHRWNSGALQVHPREAVCHAVSCCRIRTQRHHHHQAASRPGVIYCFPHDVCGVTDNEKEHSVLSIITVLLHFILNQQWKHQ